MEQKDRGCRLNASCVWGEKGQLLDDGRYRPMRSLLGDIL